MGTRGVLGWITGPSGLEAKCCYNHFDSYPSGLGRDLQDHLKEILEGTDGKLPGCEALRWVDEDDKPTEEDIKHLTRAGTVNMRVGGYDTGGPTWYQLLRGQQGNLKLLLETGYALDGSGFPRDSLFCEWGYLLDPANNEIAVIRGFNKDPEKEAPYCKLGETPEPMFDGSPGYYGCTEVWRGPVTHFLALDMDKFEEEIVKREEAEDA